LKFYLLFPKLKVLKMQCTFLVLLTPGEDLSQGTLLKYILGVARDLGKTMKKYAVIER
jgi:hypothetical protein